MCVFETQSGPGGGGGGECTLHWVVIHIRLGRNARECQIKSEIAYLSLQFAIGVENTSAV